MSNLYDIELERSVLGSCLTFPELITEIDLRDSDFYGDRHRAIWSALVFLAAEGDGVDTVRLRSRLADEGRLGLVGGDEYLLGLTDVLPLRRPPTERLGRLTRLRAIADSARRIQAACEEADLDAALEALTGAHQAALEGVKKSTTKNVYELCLPILEEMSRPPDERDLLHPGLDLMAQQIGQIPRKTSVAILADTNVGKSTVCLEVVTNMARRGIVCGYLSVEDQEPRIRARIAGMLSGVNGQKILQKQLDRDDMHLLTRGFDVIHGMREHLHISALQGGTDADVLAAMSELASRGCRAIAIDYLQKIRPSKSGERRSAEVSEIATRITSHGQRLDLVTFLVSSCSRDKTKENQCPGKHDMKESGDLEFMLDIVVGLWREFEDDHAPVWLRAIKHKDGGVGKSWCMRRDRTTGRLEEVEGSDRMDPPDANGDWSHRTRRRSRS